jgi:hypothetical protein
MTENHDPTDEGIAPDDASGMSDAELRRLLAQARAAGDEPLRRLVSSYLVLRRMSAEMLTLIETREGAQTITRTPIFSRLRHLTRRTAE